MGSSGEGFGDRIPVALAALIALVFVAGLAAVAGWLSLVLKAPHKPDEWFTQEVIAEGNHITIKVNGKVTVDWRDPENRYTRGHFALQQHHPGTVVKFRKIEVKELE